MAALTTATRDELHRLVDQVPDTEIPSVARYLRRRTRRPTLDEVLANAPVDDEPLTDADRAALARARAAAAEGRLIPHSQIRRDLGLR